MDTRKSDVTISLSRIYYLFFQNYGPQHWWPGDGLFEMMVGAILTQSTSWTNVEKAIQNLKQTGSLSPPAIRNIDIDRLAALIHSSGYYHVKAKKLKALAGWLAGYDDNLAVIFAKHLTDLRQELLNVYGIGEETADSILLYAAGKPVFVIDAYTRRIISRIGLPVAGSNYADYQKLFMNNMPHNSEVFNEYHALLVEHGKSICRKLPLCRQCCISGICSFYRSKR